MAKLPDLRMIADVSTGYNNIDMEECLRRGISVSYAASVTAEDVGEMAVALLLDVLRKTVVADRFVRQGRWPVERECRLLGSKLGGKRVGIVGLGSIGTEIAKRLEPFGCRISYTSRAAKASAPYAYVSNTGELASQSDILIICCALSDITYHLINRKVLLTLGKGGVVINVGRGSIIDEKALVKCLMDGEIAGAGLDVFEGEPVVPKELMEMDNVVLSPHRAMYSDESFSDVCEIVLSNLEAFFDNKPLISPVPVSS
uniref:Hydroxyphenylpyruvate reductase n=1 Tax=Kalanchoe fedtschenkoi TaxID=63787 RepID=A0A7N0T943_KALFE